MNTRTPPPTPRRIPRRTLHPIHARAAARREEFDDYEGGAEPNMKFSHALIVVLILHLFAVGGVLSFNMLKPKHAAAVAKVSPAVTQKPKSQPEAAVPAVHAAPASTKIASQPVVATSPAALTHTVIAGDTLTKIASTHKTTVELIEQMNGLDNRATIRVGQVLKLPPVAKTVSPQRPVLTEKKPEAQTTIKPEPARTVPVENSMTQTSIAKSPASPVPSSATPQTVQGKPSTSEGTYTISKGDNPYSIAKKLKVSYSKLLEVNKITDPTKLQIGQKLIIP